MISLGQGNLPKDVRVARDREIAVGKASHGWRAKHDPGAYRRRRGFFVEELAIDEAANLGRLDADGDSIEIVRADKVGGAAHAIISAHCGDAARLRLAARLE